MEDNRLIDIILSRIDKMESQSDTKFDKLSEKLSEMHSEMAVVKNEQKHQAKQEGRKWGIVAGGAATVVGLFLQWLWEKITMGH